MYQCVWERAHNWCELNCQFYARLTKIIAEWFILQHNFLFKNFLFSFHLILRWKNYLVGIAISSHVALGLNALTLQFLLSLGQERVEYLHKSVADDFKLPPLHSTLSLSISRQFVVHLTWHNMKCECECECMFITPDMRRQ